MNPEIWRYTTNTLKVHRENEHGCLPSPPDPRDFKFAVFAGVQPLPEHFSRLNEMPPVRHQDAVCLCAYSDKQEAFLLMNSWGDGWGVDGFSWLPYAFLSWKTEEGIPAFYEAWTCVDLPFALKQAKSIVLRVNEKTAYVDGQAVVLDVAPVIEAGRTLLPVRFIAERLGYIVNWQADTGVVELRRPN